MADDVFEFTTNSDLLDLIGGEPAADPVEGVPADGGGETPVESPAPSAPAEETPAPVVNHVVEMFAKRGYIDREAFKSDDELIDALDARYAKLEQELEEVRAQVAKPPEKPVEAPAPAAPQLFSAKISDEAIKLRDIGLVTKSGNGWVATNPAFQKYADEFQQADVAARMRIQQFAYDPDGFMKQAATPLVQEATKTYAEQIAAMQAEIASLKAVQEQSKPDPAQVWIQANSSKLWDNETLTPVGEAYKAAEEQAYRNGIKDPAMVAMMAQLAADQVSKVWKPEVKQAVPPEPEKPKKFLESAKANGHRPVNRLSEHQLASDVAIPTDNHGNPDWDALMQQTAENL